MAKFTKGQMLYEEEYNWKRDKGDSPYIGKTDKDRLDRDEGYEVLDFANSFLSDNANLESLHKFEKLIKKLPSNEVMKKNITDYLKKNWT